MTNKSIFRTVGKLTGLPVQNMRNFDALHLPLVKEFTSVQIKHLRNRQKVSQVVFAAYLNTSPSTIQKWEQGRKSPNGPSLKLLNIVDLYGLSALGDKFLYSDSQIDEETSNAMNIFVAEVLENYTPKDVVLFGSRAKGKSSIDSDIDIAVVLEKQSQKHEDIKLELESIAYDVLIKTGMFIDPLPLWVDEWNNPERFNNPELIKNIKSDGIYL